LREAGFKMFNVVETVRHIVGAPWGLAVVGVIVLAAGLPLLIWPRKANDIMWKVQQGTSPWRVRKPPFGVTIAMGCLFILIALALFVGTWEGYQG
jgi:hypothetical protein